MGFYRSTDVIANLSFAGWSVLFTVLSNFMYICVGFYWCFRSAYIKTGLRRSKFAVEAFLSTVPHVLLVYAFFSSIETFRYSVMPIAGRFYLWRHRITKMALFFYSQRKVLCIKLNRIESQSKCLPLRKMVIVPVNSRKIATHSNSLGASWLLLFS